MTWDRVLATLVPVLQEADPAWCVFGSAAKALDGEDVVPHDVDIMLSHDGAVAIEQKLAQFRTHGQQPESGKWLSRRSHYRIEGTELDVSGALMRRVGDGWVEVCPEHVKERGGIRFTTDM